MYVSRNTGSAEIKGQPQDADEDDTSEENAEPVGVSVPRAVADDTHVEENPEWEMGIRRSSTAKVRCSGTMLGSPIFRMSLRGEKRPAYLEL